MAKQTHTAGVPNTPAPTLPELGNLLSGVAWETVAPRVATTQIAGDLYIRIKDIETAFDQARAPKEGRKLFMVASSDGFRSLLLASGKIVKLSLNIGR